jgi:hypothetical protein
MSHVAAVTAAKQRVLQVKLVVKEHEACQACPLAARVDVLLCRWQLASAAGLFRHAMSLKPLMPMCGMQTMLPEPK